MKSKLDEDIVHKETEGILEKKEDSERKGCVHRLKGVVAGFGAVLFYVSSGTCVQLLNRRIPDFELNTIRSSVSLFAYSSYLVMTRKWPVVPRDMLAVTLVYILASFLNSLGYYTAVSLLPAACEVSLQNTITVLAGLVLFSVFWKERITLRKLVCAALCIVGVVMVVQPKFVSLCGTDNTTVFTEELNNVFNATNVSLNHVNYTMDHVTDSTPKGILGELNGSTSFSSFNGSTRGNNNCTKPDSLLGKIVGFIVAIIAGVMLSVCVLITIRNPCITENMLQVLFWTFMMSTVISAVVMFALETPVLPGNVFDTVLVTIIIIIIIIYFIRLSYICRVSFESCYSDANFATCLHNDRIGITLRPYWSVYYVVGKPVMYTLPLVMCLTIHGFIILVCCY